MFRNPKYYKKQKVTNDTIIFFRSIILHHNCCLDLLDLTLSWRRSLSYRNQSIYLQRNSVDWFLKNIDSVMKKLINLELRKTWTFRFLHLSPNLKKAIRLFFEMIVIFCYLKKSKTITKLWNLTWKHFLTLKKVPLSFQRCQ